MAKRSPWPVMARALLVFAFAIGLAFLVRPAAAIPCSPYDEIVERLKGKFQEKRLGFGLIGNKAVMEFYASKRGSWTIIVTRPNGIACVVAIGTDWTPTQVCQGGFCEPV